MEAALRKTEQSLAKLHKLLDNKPIEYVAMALSGEMQAYCDIEYENRSKECFVAACISSSEPPSCPSDIRITALLPFSTSRLSSARFRPADMLVPPLANALGT